MLRSCQKRVPPPASDVIAKWRSLSPSIIKDMEFEGFLYGSAHKQDKKDRVV
jgi:hypothetical protein